MQGLTDGDPLLAFRTQLAERQKWLLDELTASWEAVYASVTSVAGLSHSLEPDACPEPSMESLAALFGEQAEALLLQPLGALQRHRPLQRAMAAVQGFDASLEDLVRQVPRSVQLSGPEILAMRDPAFVNPWRRRLLAARSGKRDIRLREAVEEQLLRGLGRRSRLEGEFLQALAEACVHALAVWQHWRQHELKRHAGMDAKPLGDAMLAWRTAAGEIQVIASRSLERLGVAAKTDRSEDALLHPGRPRRRRAAAIAGRRRQWITHWSRQFRAVHGLLGLEFESVHLARETVRISAGSLEFLRAEHADLRAELDGTTAWIKAVVAGLPGAPPPSQAELIAAQDRASEWHESVAAQARRLLPETLDVADLGSWHPSRLRRQSRQSEPRRLFLDILGSAGRESVMAGFQEAETSHRAAVREIERAREVLSFGLETARDDPKGGKEIADEAGANALALLEYQSRSMPDVLAFAKPGVAQAQARVFLEFHGDLERGRLRLLAHTTGQRSARLGLELWGAGVENLRAGGRRAHGAGRRVYESCLMRIGLRPPPLAERQALERTPTLGHVMDLALSDRDLPAIYRRLFRLAPVEDPRFLVGREQELAGIGDALSRWQQGEPTAVLIIGARGSGKTSLLNCATLRMFAGLNAFRGQFCRRLSAAEEMDAFLHELFGMPNGSDIAGALKSERGIVMLEELERAFLRRAGGLDALRRFLDIVDETSHSILWVISANEAAYRFMRATVDLRRRFSHRINAMSASRAALRSAILQRHSLSGLRLEFAPPPKGDPRVDEIRRLVGMERDPEEIFFEALYQQSEGIFRSAFELWQDCIDRCEGGVVRMRVPLNPEYGLLKRELSFDDYFVLQAVLQHGSLTAEELCGVLRLRPETGRRRLHRLTALDILEPDQAGPGLRVRPQAGRLVREVLHANNLA